MKRWTVRIVICLIFGYLLNAVIAGWLAYSGLRFLYESEGALNQYASFEANAACGDGEWGWAGEAYRLFGLTTASSRLMMMCGADVESFEEAEAFSSAQIQSFLNQLPVSMPAHFARRKDGGFVPRRSDPQSWLIASGWPLRSSIGAVVQDSKTGEWSFQGGFSVSRNSPRGNSFENWYLPCHPLWVGTACNTSFYGILVLGLWMCVVGARRLRRFERGHCPRCNYKLNGDFSGGCPECGWRRETAAED